MCNVCFISQVNERELITGQKVTQVMEVSKISVNEWVIPIILYI